VSELLKTHDLTVDGVRVRLHQSGAGPDVLLLHGFPETLQSYWDVAPRLAPRFRVHAIDWPGFGASDRPRGFDYNPRGFAAFLEKLLPALELKKPHLVGPDIAMSPVLLFAAAHPDRAGRIVVGDGKWAVRTRTLSWELRVIETPILSSVLVHLAPRMAMAMTWQRGFFRPRRLPRPIWEDMLAPARYADARAISSRYFLAMNRDLATCEQQVREVKSPLLVVWGSHDVFIDKAMGEELAAVTGARLEIIPEAGHFLHQEKPAQFATLVEQFLTA
jgi:pimeloyl-ACP methyl ester carboxylesterase